MPNELPPEPPIETPRTLDASEAAFVERMRGKANEIRLDRIAEMNANRPQPELTVDLTPSGTTFGEMYTPEGIAKNAEIDKQIEEFNNSIVATKGRARNDFKKSR